ncbi:phosphoribosyltransferase family protein [Amycolatopsis sp. NPDC051045]|uniref:ComF family protein n=1 Tax=Amycolatopsis sp. NPDC051045 TaxID=3156922 RepID=UPI00343F94C8
MSDGQPARLSNRGGGYVEDVQVSAVPSGGHELVFRGPIGALEQVKLCDVSYVTRGGGVGPGWRRLWSNASAPTTATSTLLDLLGTFLTVTTPASVDFGLVLDWYKDPVQGVLPGAWPNTAVGELVHRGKYWYKDEADAAKQRQCGLALVTQLCALINRHPLLSGFDSIASVPGHDSRVLSFGARLAAAVGRQLNKPLIVCKDQTGFRPPIKDVEPSQRLSLIENTFTCRSDLSRQSVLIIDDIYSTGTTASETSRALRSVGATQVASLCPVRTMRSI